MRLKDCISGLAIFVTLTSPAQAETGPRKLLEALMADDVSIFSRYLEEGVDPNVPLAGNDFGTTSSCESAKRGNSKFLEAIVDSGAALDLVSPLAGLRSSLILCAIHYNNFDAYRLLREEGVDINSVQNPAAPDPRLFLTPIDFAVMSNRFRITMDILTRIEPTESQIRTLIRTVNQTPGVKGHPEQPYRNELSDWLKRNGYEVNGLLTK